MQQMNLDIVHKGDGYFREIGAMRKFPRKDEQFFFCKIIQLSLLCVLMERKKYFLYFHRVIFHSFINAKRHLKTQIQVVFKFS